MKRAMSSRRKFLKQLGFGTAALACGVKAFSANEASSRKPNVIFILTDDQGSVDVGCYGAKDLITPNMDRLAREGVRFNQFYVGASVCSPSRAALLTGRYPQRAKLVSNAYGDRGMPNDQVTIAEVLKGHGYRTGIFGKWHMGDTLPLSPNAQGFDEFFGHKVGCIDNYSHFFYWHGPNRHDLWKNEQEHWEDGKYFPDMVVREANRFIEENKDDPFFLYLPFNMPHYPLQAEQKFAEMYKNIKDPKRARYGAFVTALDDRIGQVLAKLDELNLRENTIVIFMSDHGHSVEERTFGGGGSAGPYRGHKGTHWEGGIRVPCIISWPDHIPKGVARDQLACSIDWFPTIAEYCGVSLPNRKIDGKSITDIIASDSASTKHDIMHWMRGKSWATRRGHWKLVYDQQLFLSDLKTDVAESKNLAGNHPEVVSQLKKLHDQWAAEVKSFRD
ncbi:MAG: sulfatase-like hydrolase/transferase [Phycisphaerae bacterium]|nr:sulfatase-like hydrolase/transferase [Phycisphaerae bacterium]